MPLVVARRGLRAVSARSSQGRLPAAFRGLLRGPSRAPSRLLPGSFRRARGRFRGADEPGPRAGTPNTVRQGATSVSNDVQWPHTVRAVARKATKSTPARPRIRHRPIRLRPIRLSPAQANEAQPGSHQSGSDHSADGEMRLGTFGGRGEEPAETAVGRAGPAVAQRPGRSGRRGFGEAGRRGLGKAAITRVGTRVPPP